MCRFRQDVHVEDCNGSSSDLVVHKYPNAGVSLGWGGAAITVVFSNIEESHFGFVGSATQRRDATTAAWQFGKFRQALTLSVVVEQKDFLNMLLKCIQHLHERLECQSV